MAARPCAQVCSPTARAGPGMNPMTARTVGIAVDPPIASVVWLNREGGSTKRAAGSAGLGQHAGEQRSGLPQPVFGR